MGRYRAVAALLCGVAACATGCVAPGGDAPDGGAPEVQEPAAAEAPPPAFHFDSGDLVIGPFDPEQVKDNLFDPCAEISDAELAAAGLEKDPVQGDHAELDARYIKACDLRSDDPYLYIGLISNAANKNIILAGSPEVAVDAGVPEIFAFRAPEHALEMCDAATETSRGTFSVSVGSVRQSENGDAYCRRAADILSNLYLSVS